MKKIYILPFISILSLQIATAQSPGGVPDSLTCWLKANQGLTISPTNQVTTWTEYSTRPTLGNFSTQGAAINKPTHVAPIVNPVGINYNPYVVFNSTISVNSISSANAVEGLSFLDATSNTIFQVINLKQSTNTGVWLKWQWATNPYASPRLGNEVNNGGFPGQVRFDFRNNNLYTTTNILNQHSLLTQSITSTQKIMRLSGLQNAINATTGTFTPGSNTGRLTLGAEPYGDDYPTHIDMAEVIIYKRELTAAEINKVESYLAVKYGFTLDQSIPTNNYISANNTNVWNRTLNMGFGNDITGIGRDDLSALNQKQSKSINSSAFITMYKGTGYAGIFPVDNATNVSSFNADNNYLIFGNNLESLTLSECADNGRVIRLSRAWKMIATGTDGLVTLAANKSFLPSDVTTLIIADDAAFNTNVTIVDLTDNGTELHASATFTGTKYFTFGTTPIALNAVADTVCFGGLGNINSSPTGGYPPISYSWNTTPPQTTSSLIGVNPGNYTVTISQGNICSYTENHSIIGSPSIMEIDNIELKSAICTSPTGSMRITAWGGSAPYLYSINGSEFQINPDFQDLTPGNYSVTVKDNFGCSKDTMVVVPSEVITLNPTVETRDAWCDADGAMGYALIKVSGGLNPYSFIWNNNIGPSSNKQENLLKGSYSVDVKDAYGCGGNIKFNIGEIPCCTYYIPSAFSPNNDGLNDEFIGNSSIEIPVFNMTIYNRYGQSVFVSGNYNVGWNGKHFGSGQDADNGVYYYYIEYRCPLQNELQILKGEVTLIR